MSVPTDCIPALMVKWNQLQLIFIHEELFRPGSLQVNTTDLGAFDDLGGANAGWTEFDPVADEEPREQEQERAMSSHGESYS